MNILVFDHSVVAYKSFWRIFAEEYEGETKDETYEFTRSYCGLIETYREMFQADACLWLLDCDRSDVWRHEVIQEYYLPRTEIWANVTDDELAELGDPHLATKFMGLTDGNTYRKVWIGPENEFHGKQLYKKSFLAASEDWDLDARKITDPELFAKVAAKVIPQYKGNRENSHWPQAAVLTKDEFRLRSTKLAQDIAPHYNGKIARGANLEADDLALAVVEKYGEKHNLIFVTTDKDWNQLALMAPNVQIYDPNTHELVNTEREAVLTLMYTKLLSGDKSDNIKSVPKAGQISGIGKTTAESIIEEVGVSSMKKWVEENCDLDALERNKVLVNLKMAPEEIRDRASYAVNKAVKPQMSKPLTMFVSPATLELAKADGQRQRLAWELAKKGGDNGKED